MKAFYAEETHVDSNNESNAGLNVDQMAALMLMKAKAEEAQAFLSEKADREMQSKISKLASFAQLGAWPSELKIIKQNWLPWRRSEFVEAWRLVDDSNLVVTDGGILARVRRSEVLLTGKIGLIVTGVSLMNFIVFYFFPVASGPDGDRFIFWMKAISASTMAFIPGMLLGLALGSLWAIGVRKYFKGEPIGGIEAVVLSKMRGSEKDEVKLAQRRAEETEISWERAIRAARGGDNRMLAEAGTSDQEWLTDPLNRPITSGR